MKQDKPQPSFPQLRTLMMITQPASWQTPSYVLASFHLPGFMSLASAAPANKHVFASGALDAPSKQRAGHSRSQNTYCYQAMSMCQGRRQTFVLCQIAAHIYHRSLNNLRVLFHFRNIRPKLIELYTLWHISKTFKYSLVLVTYFL